MTTEKEAPNSRRIAYVNLGLSVTLILAALKLGIDMGRQAEKLERVPTRDEVRLIVGAEVKPLDHRLRALEQEVGIIRDRMDRSDRTGE